MTMVLLDTHIFVWLYENQTRLSPDAIVAMKQADTMGISTITLWEIGMLFQKERLQFSRSLTNWFEHTCNAPKIRLLQITPQVAVCVSGLTMHGDPADRIIVATAIEHGVPLITADHRIAEIGLVPVIW